MHSPTGKNAAKLSVHHEMGSHGYQKSEISSGQQIGDLDYYLSLTQSDDDGYRRSCLKPEQRYMRPMWDIN